MKNGITGEQREHDHHGRWRSPNGLLRHTVSPSPPSIFPHPISVGIHRTLVAGPSSPSTAEAPPRLILFAWCPSDQILAPGAPPRLPRLSLTADWSSPSPERRLHSELPRRRRLPVPALSGPPQSPTTAQVSSTYLAGARAPPNLFPTPF